MYYNDPYHNHHHQITHRQLGYDLKVITEPTSYPVTLAELKSQLGLTTTAQDATLTLKLKAATQAFERLTGRAILPTVFRQSMHRLCFSNLMVANIISVDSWKYFDFADVEQTLTGWICETISVPSPIHLQNRIYPFANPYRVWKSYVTFTAGWANVDAVPSLVRDGILSYAASLYTMPESESAAVITSVPMRFRDICSLYATGLYGNWRN